MLLVINVSQSDRGLVGKVAEAFAKFPPGHNHSLLVAGFNDVQEEVLQLEKDLSQYFTSHRSHIYPLNAQQGWPNDMNYAFQQVCYLVPKLIKENEGWLWFELDSDPIKPNWLDSIHSAYYNDSITAEQERRPWRRYLGWETASYGTSNGEVLTPETEGTHMGSVGVYPQNTATIPLIKTLPFSGRAFQKYIQWYVHRSFTKSLLIQNNWMTSNYRLSGGQIVCDNATRMADGVGFNEPVNPSAVLVHGCKDGSLHKLLQGQEGPSATIEEDTSPESLVKEYAEKGVSITQRDAEEISARVAAIPVRQSNMSEEEREKRRQRMKEYHVRQKALKEKRELARQERAAAKLVNNNG